MAAENPNTKGTEAPTRRRSTRPLALAMAVGAVWAGLALNAQAGTVDDLIERLKDKGILSEEEYAKLKDERSAEKQKADAAAEEQKAQAEKAAAAAAASAAPAKTGSGDKWKISDQISNIELFGDLRLRYEDRRGTSTGNIASAATGASTVSSDAIDRQRWRYALRAGVRGDVGDQWFYGIRFETSDNPRSAWVTFGDDSANNGGNTGPSGKTSDKLNIGQVWLGWRATDWLTVQAGKFSNPMFTTSMVWDPDISPEGLAEKFVWKKDDNNTLFATFGQFMYSDFNPDNVKSAGIFNKQDLFLYAWEVGAEHKFSPESSVKGAINYYNYTGGKACGTANFRCTFTGEPTVAAPAGTGNFNNVANQVGINNLSVIEVPLQYRFPVSSLSGLVYGSFAKNLDGSKRATAAGKSAYGNQDKAFQVGVSLGSEGLNQTNSGGLVTGASAKKGSWEVRTYWQKIEQYALDPNLIDSDFFERTNVKGYYLAGAYAPANGVITTLRLGHATRANDQLGTGGFNSDLSQIQPLKDYNLIQFDLTLRF